VTELPDLSVLSHAEKDALIRALWEALQASERRNVELTVRLAAAERRIAELEARLNEPAKRPAAILDRGCARRRADDQAGTEKRRSSRTKKLAKGSGGAATCGGGRVAPETAEVPLAASRRPRLSSRKTCAN